MKTRDPKVAARVIREGGTVAFPTETVYGLGAAAFLPEAVAKVYEAKQRPLSHPLIVHIADWESLSRVAKHVPPKAEILLRAFWPGPLTVVLEKTDVVPSIVTAGLDSVGVRFPSHPLAQALIRESGMPIAAPSANPFGTLSPTNALHVEKGLKEQFDCLLEGDASEVGVESTIVSFLGEVPVLLRPGGIPVEWIEEKIGKVEVAGSKAVVIAPGMLPKHYSPRTPISLDGPGEEDKTHVGLLCFGPIPESPRYEIAVSLSNTSDLREAAATLYDKLHFLDSRGLKRIYVQKVPEAGLGAAINDRLTRASRS